MGSPFVGPKTVIVSRPPPCFCVVLGFRACRRPGPSSAPLPVPVLLPSLLALLSAPSSTASALLLLHVPLQLSLLPASAVLLCRARPSRLPSRPGPSSAPLPVPVLLPSLLALLSAPSSTASALLMLHVPLQLSLLPLGLLLCRLACSGKKSPLEEGDPRELPAAARPQGFSRAGPTHSVLARPL